MNSIELDRHIRCKCGKHYGIIKFRNKKTCIRCKTPVLARGETNNDR